MKFRRANWLGPMVSAYKSKAKANKPQNTGLAPVKKLFSRKTIDEILKLCFWHRPMVSASESKAKAYKPRNTGLAPAKKWFSVEQKMK